MQILHVNNLTNSNSFKGISQIRIPKGSGNPQKLLVTVDHKGDFYSYRWRRVVIDTLEKGKVISSKVFGDGKKTMGLGEVCRIHEEINKMTNYEQDNTYGDILTDMFDKQSQFETFL